MADIGWSEIKTAPKDGTEVILRVEVRAGIPNKCLVGHWMPGGYCIEDHPAIDEGWYFWNGCMFDKAAKPTHWMPIPEFPSKGACICTRIPGNDWHLEKCPQHKDKR